MRQTGFVLQAYQTCLWRLSET